MSISTDSALKLLATARNLAKLDPKDKLVPAVVADLNQQVSQLASGQDNSGFLKEQIEKLQQAAEAPAKNYARVVEIMKGLSRAAQISERPQYAALRPRISAIVEKVAGIFSEVDTVQDLDKPLEQIEKAVHSLYGKQDSNSTFYFERRGKGHHSARPNEEIS